MTNRTSNSFVASISYNCSLTNLHNFTVASLDSSGDCEIRNDTNLQIDNSTIIVECSNVTNSSGRPWSFELQREFTIDRTNTTENISITLQPLSLENINITVNNSINLTSATIHVPNCARIADLKYLFIRCNASNSLDVSLSDNCTHVCEDLTPGCNHTAYLFLDSFTYPDNNETLPRMNQSTTFIQGKQTGERIESSRCI